MQDTILETHQSEALAVLVVWVPMLASDSEAAAGEASRVFTDMRVVHFYDPKRRASAAVAASVGGVGQFAWDTYLLYRPGRRWVDGPPGPDAWMHQLGESGWADPTRYRWAESLTAELARAAASLLES